MEQIFEKAAGLVIGSPVYYNSAISRIVISNLEILFVTYGIPKEETPGIVALPFYLVDKLFSSRKCPDIFKRCIGKIFKGIGC